MRYVFGVLHICTYTEAACMYTCGDIYIYSNIYTHTEAARARDALAAERQRFEETLAAERTAASAKVEG